MCFIKYLPTHLAYFTWSSNEIKARLEWGEIRGRMVVEKEQELRDKLHRQELIELWHKCARVEEMNLNSISRDRH